MKKIMSLLLAAMMLIGLFAGCGGETASQPEAVSEPASVSEASAAAAEETPEAPAAEEEPAPAEEISVEAAAEPVTISYPLEGDDLTLSMWVSVFIGSPYSDHPVFVAAEEATGVKIEFLETNPGAERENFQLTVASGDYPDVFRGLNNFYTGGASAAISDEVIYDLAPYMEEFAPDYWSLLNGEAYAASIKDVYDDEGRMGCMFQLSSNPNYTSQSIMFRADWLEELGMEIPTTIEENYEYMKATKETFGATNACYMNDEFQYTELANAYGVAGYTLSAVGSSGSHFFQVDGVAKSSFNETGFQSYLKTLNQWYSEGIINKDFISNQSGTMTEYLYAAGNDCGRYNQVQVGQVSTLYETAATNGIDGYELVPGVPMVENEGDVQHFKQTSVFGANLAVTTACEDVELAVKWLNYFSTEDGILLCNYGVEGSSWERDAEGNPVYTDFYTNNPDYPISQVEEALCMPQMCTVKIVDRMDYVYDELAQQALDTWTNNEFADSAYVLPSGMTFNTEEQEVITANLSDIETYAAECLPKFIMGEMDAEADWDEFVSNVESMGLQDVLDAYQSCLDRYYAR